MSTILEVNDLYTHFFTDEGVVKAVDGVSFSVSEGETVCVVGESGCGKSVTARSILGIVQKPGRTVAGNIWLHRKNSSAIDLTVLDPKGKAFREIRGGEIGMVFQEPMSSLSPVHTIGNQLTEAVQLHMPLNKKDAIDRGVQLLRRVGIPNPAERMDSYPFELSGGMLQRVMIAIALSCNPRVLIADEPTTALDVTMQATILDLIKELQEESGMSVIFITHDLGVVAEIADQVVVMYLGKDVETGPVEAIFREPKHPYTRALLNSMPSTGVTHREDLYSIPGMVPHPFERPSGCPFHPRCEAFMEGTCDRIVPPREIPIVGHEVRCLLYTDEGRLQNRVLTNREGSHEGK